MIQNHGKPLLHDVKTATNEFNILSDCSTCCLIARTIPLSNWSDFHWMHPTHPNETATMNATEEKKLIK